jgi:hypothetical protein
MYLRYQSSLLEPLLHLDLLGQQEPLLLLDVPINYKSISCTCTTGACAVLGCVYTTRARAAPGRVYTTAACVTGCVHLDVSTPQGPELHLDLAE